MKLTMITISTVTILIILMVLSVGTFTGCPPPWRTPTTSPTPAPTVTPPPGCPEGAILRSYSDSGVDGTWFTSDDSISYLERKEYVNCSQIDGKCYGSWYGGQGPDNEWYTTDDVPFHWWVMMDETTLVGYNDPGDDGIYFNEDDTIELVEDISASILYEDPGIDGEWFTGDDVISAHWGYTLDDDGNVVMLVSYKDPGSDGIWFTDDDELGDHWWGYYWTAEYEGEDNSWGSWTKQVRYEGTGPDGEWFTDDDVVRDFSTYEFGDGNNFFTKEYIYNDPGPDGVMFTTDDVLSGYCEVENYYGPTPPPTQAGTPPPTPTPPMMIQDYESEEVTPDNAAPVNVWGGTDWTWAFNGDNDGDGTNGTINEITAFSINTDGANSTTRSMTVAYNIGDNDTTENDGCANPGYGMSSTIPVDLSNSTGLSFYAKGINILTLMIYVNTTEQLAISQYNSYITHVDLTGDWQLFEIPWTIFLAADWGNNIPLIDPSQIEEIGFFVEECNGIQTAGEYSLDEISTFTGPPPPLMIQNFESEDVIPDGAIPVNIWNIWDFAFFYNGDGDGDGTNGTTNEITAFSITSDGADSTTKSTTVAYNIGDNDTVENEGCAQAGYCTYSGFSVDLSNNTGLCFYAKGNSITTLSVSVGTTEQIAIEPTNNYCTTVDITGNWQQFTIPWTSFIAADWGNNIPIIDPSQVEDIKFCVKECSGIQTAGEFSLDEIATYIE